MARDTAYPKTTCVIVLKTSKYSDARTKIKTLKNRNIDEILDLDHNIPGISEKMVIIDIGVGEKFIEIYKKKYKL